MKVKELINLLEQLDPDYDISLSIYEGRDDEGYEKNACCEHFVVHECSYGEHEITGIEMDAWENETYRKEFCDRYDYPKNKFYKRS